jgi:hypothetical protein
MTALEDQLREVLRERATRPRLGNDVAGDAIRGAAALRRRRSLSVTAAAALAVIVAISGMVLSQPSAAPVAPAHPSTPSTSGPPSSQSTVDIYGVHLDVLDSSDLLRTTDGQTFQLGQGRISVVRVPAGWLYGPAGQNLTLLTSTGQRTELPATAVQAGGFDQPAGPVVSADGQHLAWVNGGQLHAADLSVDGLTNVVSSPAPAGSFADTWIGARVVVGQPTGVGCCGYNPDRFDVWDPTDGNFVPKWTSGLADIYGPVPSGATPLANVEGQVNGAGCLARVNGVKNLSTVDTKCPTNLGYESLMHLLSPDGAHLLELDFSTGARFMVIDTRTLTVTGYCGGNEPIAFEDSANALIWNSTAQQMLRCDIRTGTTSPLAHPLSPSDQALVPRYGF